MLRDDREFARLDAESSVSRGSRATDNLARSAGNCTDQILVFLAEALARVIAHTEKTSTNHGIIEQLPGEVVYYCRDGVVAA